MEVVFANFVSFLLITDVKTAVLMICFNQRLYF